MKKLWVTGLYLIFCTIAFAQDDVASVRANAREYMQSGDLDNAVLVLNKAYEANKTNTDVQKDLVLAYYYKKNYDMALEVLKPLLQSADVDAPAYQLAGTIYKAKEDYKAAEGAYKEAIKAFPNNGALYSEYGDLLTYLKNPAGALAQWQKGMQVAPSYGGNYYNASIYYFKQPEDKIWAIIYGEIYANMESLNPKAGVIKKMVLDAYKQKLFVNNDLASIAASEKNEFAKAVITTFAKQSGISAKGLTPETLAMIRTRFVLDWKNTYAQKFPFKLFDYHQALMKDGLFDAYNQWMFGPVDNQATFENWVSTHKENFEKFTTFHTSRVFKMPAGQVYSAK